MATLNLWLCCTSKKYISYITLKKPYTFPISDSQKKREWESERQPIQRLVRVGPSPYHLLYKWPFRANLRPLRNPNATRAAIPEHHQPHPPSERSGEREARRGEANMAAAAVYGAGGAMKGGKLGMEEARELQLNRIRITLSSKNVKNLEKGNPFFLFFFYSFSSLSFRED